MGRGRPKKNPLLVADKRFTMRISKHNLDIFRDIARKDGKSIAETILSAMSMYKESKGF